MKPPQQGGEWVSRDLSEPLRQGDVFRWIGATDATHPWKRYGIVVTADCDVALDKHRGALSYCPVLILEDFLRLFWLPDELSRQLEYLYGLVVIDLVGLKQKYASQYDQPIDGDVIKGWLERRRPEGIATDLQVPKGIEREALVSRLTICDRLERAPSLTTLADQVSVLAIVKVAGINPSPDKVSAQQDKVWRDIAARIRRIAGDLFFLNELGHGTTGGFVVYLRRIGEVSEKAIAIDPLTEKHGTSIEAVRISRIAPPFRYRLTQKLAAVFADIGLPDNYDVQCEETVHELGITLGVTKAVSGGQSNV